MKIHEKSKYVKEKTVRAEEEVISWELLLVVVLTHEDYICVMYELIWFSKPQKKTLKAKSLKPVLDLLIQCRMPGR